jgi:hypothetical protein
VKERQQADAEISECDELGKTSLIPEEMWPLHFPQQGQLGDSTVDME